MTLAWTDDVDKILKPGLRTKSRGSLHSTPESTMEQASLQQPDLTMAPHISTGRRRRQPFALDMEQRTGGAALISLILIKFCSMRVMSLSRLSHDCPGKDRWCTTVAPRTTAGHNLFFRIVFVAHNRHIHTMVVPFRLGQEDKTLYTPQLVRQI